jgi:CelD/BcsL family acetyltransferase involved in cellulose biosynthesis
MDYTIMTPAAVVRAEFPGRSTRLRADIVTTRDGLEALAGEWNDLLFSSPACSVFLTWEWITAWLETIRPDARLFVVVVRDEQGRLAAVGPFYQAACTLVGLLEYSALRILGDAVSGSEYGNIIARRDVEQDATIAVLSFLADHTGSWDLIWLPGMGPTAHAARSLQAAARHTGFAFRTREAEFARIRLPGSFEAYLNGLPAKIRYQMRRGLEKLEQQHAGILENCGKKDALRPSLEDLFALHRSRWQERGMSGVFGDSRMRSFYHAVGLAMLEKGWLRLDRLIVGGRAVAAQFGFSFQGVFCGLQRGFDPSFPNVPGGLGTALRSMVLRRCFAEGIRTYDFLGGFTEAKGRAGAERTIGCDMLIFRSSIANELLRRSRTWPTGRYLHFSGESDEAIHAGCPTDRPDTGGHDVRLPRL